MTELPKLTLERIEEYLKSSDNQTAYERANMIFTTKCEVVFTSTDVKFYRTHKSDGTATLQIVFRVGLGSPYWLIWTMTDDQARIMMDKFPKYFEELKSFNSFVHIRMEQKHVEGGE